MNKLARVTLRWPALSVLALLAFVAVLFLPTVAAAPGEIVITASTYQNRYPNELEFNLSARSDSEIREALLYYSFAGQPAKTSVRPEFTPGQEVTVQWIWNTKRTFAPPATDVTYYWTLKNAAGIEASTTPVTITLDDTRFQWNKVTEGKVSLYWYSGDEASARKLLKEAVRAVNDLARDAGIGLDEPVKLLIYGSQRDMLGAMEKTANEWTGGRSYSEFGVVVIAVDPTPRGMDFGLRAVPHELSHVVIHRATDNPYGDLPHWLNEGLAMHAEGPIEANYKDALDRAIKDRKLFTLRTISSNFPADGEAARLSYAQSASVVAYMLNTYGPEKMGKLLSIFKEGSTTDNALKQAYGFTMAELENQWRASIGAAVQPTPAPQAAPPPANAPVPVTAPAPTAASGVPQWIIIAVVVVAILVIVGAAGVARMRRS